MSGEELPKGWAEVRIADVCAVNPRDEHLDDAVEVTFVPMAAVSEVTGTIERPEVRKTQDVRKGFTSFVDEDVIFAKITPCMENGKSAVARGLLNGRGYGSTEFVVLRSKGSINPSFLHRFVRQDAYRREARGTMQSGVGQARVPKEFIENTTLMLPPLPEQQRIVARLDALQARSRAAREALAEVPALLDTLRQSLLSAAFRGDLTAEWRAKNPDGEGVSALRARIDSGLVPAAGRKGRSARSAQVEEPIEELWAVPASWRWVAVEDVGNLQLGRRRAPEYRDYPIERPYLRVANIKADRIDFADLEHMRWTEAEIELFTLRPGDILLSEGQSLELVGQSAVYRGEVSDLLYQSSLHRFRCIPGGPTPEFCQLVFLNHLWNGVFVRHASITTNIAHLPSGKLKRVPFPLPPLAEQAEIVRLVRGALDQLPILRDQGSRALRELDTLDQSILARAFRGELVDQDPNDEPAEVLLARIRSEGDAPASRGRARRSG